MSRRTKNNKMACPPSEDSTQSDQSLGCVLSGYLRTQCFFTWTAKTLICHEGAEIHLQCSYEMKLELPIKIVPKFTIIFCQVTIIMHF